MKAYQVIKKYMEENSIKCSDMAESIGMSCDIVNQILDGTKVLKADELIKICHFLSLDLPMFI